MGRFARVVQEHGFGSPPEGSRTHEDDVVTLLALARHDDAVTRQVAVRNLCTCHVRADDDRVWPALLERFEEDSDPRVRREALHTLTDSTPASRVADVVAALERRYGDPEPSLRRLIR
jgi:hypothetical protein